MDYYQAETEDIGKNHGILQAETKAVERRVSTCLTCQASGESTGRDGTKKIDVLQVEMEDAKHKDETKGAEY